MFDSFFPVGELKPVDFATLELSGKPNQYLVCPADLCAAAAHAEPPVFEVPAPKLAQAWAAVVAREPRVTRLAEDAAALQFDYVQRSALWRFPDIVTVRFIALSPETATVAVFSRAIYGYGDVGVNRKRVTAWLRLLGEAVARRAAWRPGAVARGP